MFHNLQNYRLKTVLINPSEGSKVFQVHSLPYLQVCANQIKEMKNQSLREALKIKPHFCLLLKMSKKNTNTK